MLEILPIKAESDFLNDIYSLILQYGGLIFSETENPIHSFSKAINNKNYKGLAAFKNNKLFAFCMLYNFKKISDKYFNCYIYGASLRGFSKELNAAMNFIMNDLKKQGCIMLRLETREYNLPMRHFAQRLKFKKVGSLECSGIINNKFIKNILYEKKL